LSKRKKFDSESIYSGPELNTPRRPVRWKKNPSQKYIELPGNSFSLKRCDFESVYGVGADDIARAFHQVFTILNEEQVYSVMTLRNYFDNGVKRVMKFSVAWKEKRKISQIALKDLDQEFMRAYLNSLKEEYGDTSQVWSIYKCARTLLKKMIQYGWLEYDAVPVIHATRIPRGEGHKAYSHDERVRILRHLKKHVANILDGKKPYNAEELSILASTIAMRTGLNSAPLLDLNVDCIQPHLKPGLYFLESYKHRANSVQYTHIQSSKKLTNYDVVLPDVVTIIESILVRNYKARNAHDKLKKFLFVFPFRREGSVSSQLTNSTMWARMYKWCRDTSLVDSENNPLNITVSRLRKTYVNRVWELSNNDQVIAAKLGNHTPKVMKDHYLAAPDQATRNFRLMGEVRVEELTSGDCEDVAEITPVSRCADIENGQFAPGKSGALCSNFLACVRCSSFVVTADDLHRLYSFYWSIVREREKVGSKKWNKYFAHITRIIDQDIATQFPEELVRRERNRAKESPHIFWEYSGELFQ